MASVNSPVAAVPAATQWGRELQELRLSAGLSQPHLAEIVGVSVSTVQNWEGGLHRPKAGCRMALAAALGISPHELKEMLAGRRTAEKCIAERQAPWETGHGLGGVAGSDPVDLEKEGVMDRNRREALAGIAATGATFVVDPAGSTFEPLCESVRQAFELRAHTVEDWEEVAWSVGQLFMITPPGQMLKRLLGEVAALQHVVHGTSDERLKRGLRVPCAQLATMTALSFSDIGDGLQARNWWATARHLADLSSHDMLQIWVRGIEAQRLRYTDPHLALKRADEAIVIGGGAMVYRNDGRVTTGPATARAVALALLGSHTEAQQTLLTVRRAVDAISPTPIGGALTMGGWNEGSLLTFEANVYTYTRTYREAARAQDAALKLYPESYAGRCAALRLRQARRLVNEGHIGDGIKHALDVMQQLDPARKTSILAMESQEVLSVVPASERRRSIVAEYRDCLALPAAG